MAKASRALLRRIRTVQNTRRITKTMELVSASKLKRATERVNAARPYAEALREVLGDLVTPELVERFPLLRQPAAHAAELAKPLIDAFVRGELGRVEFVHVQYRSALSTPPTTTPVLPVPAPDKKGPKPDYLLAPSAEAILTELLPLYVQNTLYRGLAETAAGEHGARRTAMKSATDNATDLMNLLRRTYNKQRQAGITQEISEIVGGASALQG